MSHPTSPFSAPVTSNFGAAMDLLHQASELEDWHPPAPFAQPPVSDFVNSALIEKEFVIAVGSATCNSRFHFFESLYEDYLARGVDEPQVRKAFIRALSFRRCKAVELLQTLIRRILINRNLDEEDFEMLASLISDLGSRELLNMILRRTKGSLQKPSFYSHLICCATEKLDPCDIRLATEIADEMGDAGVEWTNATLFHMINGFAKMPRVPYDAIDGLVQLFLDSGHNLETSVIGSIIGACERANHVDDLRKAIAIVNKVPLELQNKCIEVVGSCDFQRPSGDNCIYYLVDPLSVDVTTLSPSGGDASTGSFFVFPFSVMRSLCEKSSLHPESHVIFTTKILPLRDLFLRFPRQFVVVPPSCELQLRLDALEMDLLAGTSNAQSDADANLSLPVNGGISQIISFAKAATTVCCCVGKNMRVLSSNAALVKELTPLTSKYPSSWFGICEKFTQCIIPPG